MVTSLKRSRACTAPISAPRPAAGHHRPTPPPETPRHPQASSGQSPVWSLFFSPLVLVYKVLLCLLRVYFPVLCKFWQIYSVVNGDRLQKGLCHTQVCCTQSPCPCSRPLLTRTSTDVQTQLCLSLCGVPGSWCAQGWLEPSECLWWEWGLILNVNLPLLPSCWGFSFALGCGVSPHSHSKAMQLLFQHLCLSVLEWNVLECKPCHFLAVWPLSGYVFLYCIFSLCIMWVIITYT